ELYDYNLSEINTNLNNLIGFEVDSFEEDSSSNSSDDNNIEDQKKNEEEIRSSWISLAEIGPNIQIYVSLEFGSCDIDINHDWIACGESLLSDVKSLDTIDSKILNYKQRVAVRNWLYKIASKNGLFENDSPILLVLAPTVGEQLKWLQNKLWNAFPNCHNIPFGSRLIIFVGDFGQLPPVCNLLMYAKTYSSNSISEDGRIVYSQFQKVYKLDIVQLQANINNININKLHMLNCLVAKICAIHTLGRTEAKKADSDDTKAASLINSAIGTIEDIFFNDNHENNSLPIAVLTLIAASLINSTIGTIKDIFFNDNYENNLLPTAVLVAFAKYNGPTITTSEGSPSFYVNYNYTQISKFDLTKSHDLSLKK
ncbi:9855_t:CDS:2, partial [Racocetra persica]